MSKKLIVLLIAFLFLGCGSKPKQYPVQHKFDSKQRQMLTSVALSYRGAPYKYGGDSSKGFDCSGFVNRVYRDALHLKLPRTVSKLFQISYKIHPIYARSGDLVFFAVKNQKADHVGILLDRGRFIHASNSRGVVISHLDEKYYNRRFICLRRLK